MRLRIASLLDSGMSDIFIEKRCLIEFGAEPRETQVILRGMRQLQVDLSRVGHPDEVIESDDERRFDSDFGHALGLDWPNHD